jgi:two-component sensor histidine kinase
MALGAERPQAEPLSLHLLLVLLFLLNGAALITPVFYSKALQQRINQHNEYMAVINEELRHRLRNLFAVVSAVFHQSLKSSAARDELGKLISGRIQALASAQDLLTVTSRRCKLRALVEKVTGPLAPDDLRLRSAGPDVSLPAEATTPFALILHELATNALKYGAWNPRNEGVVSLEWREREGGQLEFEWREQVMGKVAKATRQGFGSALLRSGLPGGTVSHEIRASGAWCRIELQL